jgi:hypothetical protein
MTLSKQRELVPLHGDWLVPALISSGTNEPRHSLHMSAFHMVVCDDTELTLGFLIYIYCLKIGRTLSEFRRPLLRISIVFWL